MGQNRSVLYLSFACVLLFLTGEASATNYTLWIHGRTASATTQVGNYADFSYWGPSSTSAGVNKKAVNWDGRSSISATNVKIRDALDCFCTGSNWCYIAAHDAGNLHIGYALALYGTSTRYKKNATPSSSGICGNTDGTTQSGWNLKWVAVAGGLGGGTELADYGGWNAYPLDANLKTTTARALYDHNQTRNMKFYMFAGASGTLYSTTLPGQDDEAVAYHSSGGVSGSTGAAFGNPADWFSNDLNVGTAACEGGATKWTNHSVTLRDDSEVYGHYPYGNWSGIVSKIREYAATYAK